MRYSTRKRTMAWMMTILMFLEGSGLFGGLNAVADTLGEEVTIQSWNEQIDECVDLTGDVFDQVTAGEQVNLVVTLEQTPENGMPHDVQIATAKEGEEQIDEIIDLHAGNETDENEAEAPASVTDSGENAGTENNATEQPETPEIDGGNTDETETGDIETVLEDENTDGTEEQTENGTEENQTEDETEDETEENQTEDDVTVPEEENTDGTEEQTEDDVTVPEDENTDGTEEQTEDETEENQTEDDVTVPEDENTDGTEEQTEDETEENQTEDETEENQTEDDVTVPEDENTDGTEEQTEVETTDPTDETNADPAEEETIEQEVVPFAANVISVSDYVRIGESRLVFSVALEGGVAPYTVEVTEICGGTTSTVAMAWDEAGVYEADFTPFMASINYRLTVTMKDSAGSVCESPVYAVPVSVSEQEHKDRWLYSVRDASHTGKWTEDLLSVAITQIGVESSVRDFILKDGTFAFYSRYGHWARNAYLPWCAAFVGFCAEYAGIDPAALGYNLSVSSWMAAAKRMGAFRGVDYVPTSGDLIFLYLNGDEDTHHIGIVSGYAGDCVYTIEGNVAGRVVNRSRYFTTDEYTVLGYVDINYLQHPNAEEEEPETQQQAEPETDGNTDTNREEEEDPIQEQPRDYTGVAGSWASFRVNCEGAASYQWQRHLIGSGDDDWQDITDGVCDAIGYQTAELLIPATEENARYEYRCAIVLKEEEEADALTSLFRTVFGFSVAMAEGGTVFSNPVSMRLTANPPDTGVGSDSIAVFLEKNGSEIDLSSGNASIYYNADPSHPTTLIVRWGSNLSDIQHANQFSTLQYLDANGIAHNLTFTTGNASSNINITPGQRKAEISNVDLSGLNAYSSGYQILVQITDVTQGETTGCRIYNSLNDKIIIEKAPFEWPNPQFVAGTDGLVDWNTLQTVTEELTSPEFYHYKVYRLHDYYGGYVNGSYTSIPGQCVADVTSAEQSLNFHTYISQYGSGVYGITVQAIPGPTQENNYAPSTGAELDKLVLYMDTTLPTISNITTGTAIGKITASIFDADGGLYNWAVTTDSESSRVADGRKKKVDKNLGNGKTYAIETTVSETGTYYIHVWDCYRNSVTSDPIKAKKVSIVDLYASTGVAISLSKIVFEGQQIPLSDIITFTPVRKGYRYVGIFDAPTGGNEVTALTYAGDVYCRWEMADPEITVSTATVSRTYDGTATVITAAEDAVKSFYGADVTWEWYKDGVKVTDGVSLDGKSLSVKNVADSGSYKVLASATIDGTVVSAEQTVSVTISKAEISVSAADINNVPYGTELSSGMLLYDVAGLLGGDTLAGIGITVAVTTDYQPMDDVGTYDIDIVLTGTAANYTVETNEGTLTIVPRNLTNDALVSNTWPAPDDGKIIFDGQAHMLEPIVQYWNPSVTLVKGEENDYLLQYDTADNYTDVGTHTVQVLFRNNYTGTYTATFEVLPADLTRTYVTIDGWNFDGTAAGSAGHTPSIAGTFIKLNADNSIITYSWYSHDVDNASYTPIAEPVNAGTYGVRAYIQALEGAPFESHEILTYTDFTILPRDLKIHAQSDSKIYDGTALECDEWYIDEETPMLGADTVNAVTVTGSRTSVGSSDNVPSNAVLSKNTIASNYNIQYINGKLTIMDGTLPEPEQVRWNQNTVGLAQWNSVNVRGTGVAYNVQLYRVDGETATPIGTAVQTAGTGYNFNAAIHGDFLTVQQPYAYAVSVQAVPVEYQENGTYIPNPDNNFKPSGYSDRGSLLNTMILTLAPDEGIESAEIENADAADGGKFLISGESANIGNAVAKYGYDVGDADGLIWCAQDTNVTVFSGTMRSTKVIASPAAPGTYAVDVLSMDEQPYIETDSVHAVPMTDGSGNVQIFFDAFDSLYIKQYAVSTESDPGLVTEWKDAGDVQGLNTFSDTVTDVGTYYVHVFDGTNYATSSASLTMYELTFAPGSDEVTGSVTRVLKPANVTVNLPAGESDDGFQWLNHDMSYWTDTNGMRYLPGGVYGNNGDMTFTGNWITGQVTYYVRQFYQPLDGETVAPYSATADEVFSGTNLFNTEIPFNRSRMVREKTGFELDKVLLNGVEMSGEEGSIFLDENNSNTIDIYYKRKSYNLTYRLSGGEGDYGLPADRKVPFGAVIPKLDVETTHPTREGYDFMGWWYNDSFIRPETMPGEDLEVKAYFTPKYLTYNVVYLLENEDGTYTQISDAYTDQYGAFVGETISIATTPELTHLDGPATPNEKYKTFIGYEPDGVEVQYVATATDLHIASGVGGKLEVDTVQLEYHQGSQPFVMYYYKRAYFNLTLQVTIGNRDGTEGPGEVFTYTEKVRYGDQPSFTPDMSLIPYPRYAGTTLADVNSFAELEQLGYHVVGDDATDYWSQGIDIASYFPDEAALGATFIPAYADWSTGVRPETMPASDVKVVVGYGITYVTGPGHGGGGGGEWNRGFMFYQMADGKYWGLTREKNPDASYWMDDVMYITVVPETISVVPEAYHSKTGMMVYDLPIVLEHTVASPTDLGYDDDGNLRVTMENLGESITKSYVGVYRYPNGDPIISQICEYYTAYRLYVDGQFVAVYFPQNASRNTIVQLPYDSEYLKDITGFQFDVSDTRNWLRDIVLFNHVDLYGFVSRDKHYLTKNGDCDDYTTNTTQDYFGSIQTLPGMKNGAKKGCRFLGWDLYAATYYAAADDWLYGVVLDEQGNVVLDPETGEPMINEEATPLTSIRIDDPDTLDPENYNATPSAEETAISYKINYVTDGAGNFVLDEFGDKQIDSVQIVLPQKDVYAIAQWEPMPVEHEIVHYYAGLDQQYSVLETRAMRNAAGEKTSWAESGEAEQNNVDYVKTVTGAEGYEGETYTAVRTRYGKPADATRDTEYTDYVICYYRGTEVREDKLLCKVVNRYVMHDSEPELASFDQSGSMFKFDDAIRTEYASQKMLYSYTDDGGNPVTVKMPNSADLKYFYLRKEYQINCNEAGIEDNPAVYATDNGSTATVSGGDTDEEAAVKGADIYVAGEYYALNGQVGKGYEVVGFFNRDDVVSGGELVPAMLAGAVATGTDLCVEDTTYQDEHFVLVIEPHEPVKPDVEIQRSTSYIYGYSSPANLKASVHPGTARYFEETVVLENGYSWYIADPAGTVVDGSGVHWRKVSGNGTEIPFPTGLNVGEYKYKLTVTVKNKYNGRTVQTTLDDCPACTITVRPKPVDITVFGGSQQYDATDDHHFTLFNGHSMRFFGDDAQLKVYVTESAEAAQQATEADPTGAQSVAGEAEWVELTSWDTITSAPFCYRNVVEDGYTLYYKVESVNTNYVPKHPEVRSANLQITPAMITGYGVGYLEKVYDGTVDLTSDNIDYVVKGLNPTNHSNGIIEIEGILPGDDGTYKAKYESAEYSGTHSSGAYQHVDYANKVVLHNVSMVFTDESGDHENYVFADGAVLEINAAITARPLPVVWSTQADGNTDESGFYYIFNTKAHTLVADHEEGSAVEGENPQLIVTRKGNGVRVGSYTTKATIDDTEEEKQNHHYRPTDYRLENDTSVFAVRPAEVVIEPIAAAVNDGAHDRTGYADGDGYQHYVFNGETGLGYPQYTTTGIPSGYKISYTTLVTSNRDAGTYSGIGAVESSVVILDASGKDATDDFTVDCILKPIIIDPRPVTVRNVKTKDKYYDGTTTAKIKTLTEYLPTHNSATVEGTVDGEVLKVKGLGGTFRNATPCCDPDDPCYWEKTVDVDYTYAQLVVCPGLNPVNPGLVKASNYVLDVANSAKTSSAHIYIEPVAFIYQVVDQYPGDNTQDIVYGEDLTLRIYYINSEEKSISPDRVTGTAQVVINGKTISLTVDCTAADVKTDGNGKKYTEVTIPYDAAHLGKPKAGAYRITTPSATQSSLKCDDLGGEYYRFDNWNAVDVLIGKRPINMDAKTGYAGVSKNYDGTTGTTEANNTSLKNDSWVANPTSATESGVYDNDPVTLASFTASYDTAETTATTVTVTTLKLDTESNKNYKIVNNSYDVPGAILARTVYVIPADKTKVYGDADPALTWEAWTEIDGDGKGKGTKIGSEAGAVAPNTMLNVSITRDVGNTVGSYTITTSEQSANPNYNVTYKTANFAITKRLLTVSPNADKTITYGDKYAGTVFTAYGITAENWASGDDAVYMSSLVGAVSGYSVQKGTDTPIALAEGTLIHTGSYVAGVSLNQDALDNYVTTNYDIAYDTKTLTVNKKLVRVTEGVTASDKVYDGNKTATVSVTGAVFDGLIPEDIPGVVLTLVAEEVTGQFNSKNVDEANTVAITYTKSALVNDDYELDTDTGDGHSQASAPAQITPKAMTIKAEDKVVLYGTAPSALPAFTWAADATKFVPGENAGNALDGVGAQFDMNPEYTPLLPANTAITLTVSGITALHGNYAITYEPGTLLVSDNVFSAPVMTWDDDHPGTINWNDVMHIGSVNPEKYVITLYKDGTAIDVRNVPDLEGEDNTYDIDFAGVIYGENGGPGYYEVTGQTISEKPDDVQNSPEGTKSAKLYAAYVNVAFTEDETTTAGKSASPAIDLLRTKDSAAASMGTNQKATMLLISGDSMSVTASIANDTGYDDAETEVTTKKLTIGDSAIVDAAFNVATTLGYTITLKSGLTSAAPVESRITYTAKPATLQLSMNLYYSNVDVMDKAEEKGLVYGYDSEKVRVTTTAVPTDADNVTNAEYDYSVVWKYGTAAYSRTTVTGLTGLVWDKTTSPSQLFPSDLGVVLYSPDPLYPVEVTVTATRKDNGKTTTGNASYIVQLFPAPITPTIQNSEWTYGETREYQYVTAEGNPGNRPVRYFYSESPYGDAANLPTPIGSFAIPSDWTEGFPTEAGTYYIYAYVPASQNYKSGWSTSYEWSNSNPTTFVIDKAKLDTPKNLAIKDETAYGFVQYDQVSLFTPSYVNDASKTITNSNTENMLENKGVGNTSAITVKYDVVLTRTDLDADGTPIAGDEHTETLETWTGIEYSELPLDFSTKLLKTGQYTVTAKAMSSNTDNCLDSDPVSVSMKVCRTVQQTTHGVTDSDDVKRDYDGHATILSIKEAVPEGTTYSWKRYAEDKTVLDAAEVGTDATLTLYDAVQSGYYLCEMTEPGGKQYSTIIKIVIDKIDVVVKADSATKVYDGTPLANPGFTVSGDLTLEDPRENRTTIDEVSADKAYIDLSMPTEQQECKHTFTVQMTEGSSQTDAHTDNTATPANAQNDCGKILNVVKTPIVITRTTGDDDPVDATANFNITYEDGTLTVTRRPLDDLDGKVTIADVEDVTYNGEEFKPEPAVTYVTPDERVLTLISGTANDFTYYYTDNLESYSMYACEALVFAKATPYGNYSGTIMTSFVIWPRVIYLVAQDSEKVYDGTELYYAGFELADMTDLDDRDDLSYAPVANATSALDATASTSLHTITVTMTEDSCQLDAYTDNTADPATTDTLVDTDDRTYGLNYNTINRVIIMRGTEDATVNYDIHINDDNSAETDTDLGLLKVTKKPLTDSDVTMAQPDDVIYNGEEHKATPAITYTPASAPELTLTEGSEADFTFSYAEAYTGSNNVLAKDIGTVTVTATANECNCNYSGSIDKTYEITKRNLTVKALDSTKVYDHTALTYAGFAITVGTDTGMDDETTLAYLPDPFTQSTTVIPDATAASTLHTAHVDMTALSTITNVGSTANEIDDTTFRVIRNVDSADVTDSYTVTLEDGTLTITPIEVTITMNDLSVMESQAADWDSYWSGSQSAPDLRGYLITPSLNSSEPGAYDFDKELDESLWQHYNTTGDVTLNCAYTKADTHTGTGSRSISLNLPADNIVDNYKITIIPGTLTITSMGFTVDAGTKTLWAFESTYMGPHMEEYKTVITAADDMVVPVDQRPADYVSDAALLSRGTYVLGATADTGLALKDHALVTADAAIAGSATANSTFGFTVNGADMQNEESFTMSVTDPTNPSAELILFNHNAITEPGEIGSFNVTMTSQNTWTDEGGHLVTGDPDVILLKINVQRIAAQLMATVPLVLVFKTNIDGGTADVSSGSYYIDNNSSMRVELTDETVETPAGSLVSETKEETTLPGGRDLYFIGFADELTGSTLTTPRSIYADGTAGDADHYHPIDHISFSKLSFVTTQDRSKGVQVSTITYTVTIPETDLD